MNKIKVLHVLGGLDSGGAETFVMNVYRKIDLTKFHFDFLVHNPDKDFYLNEVKEKGSKVYYISRYKLYNHFKYVMALNDFFNKHSDYKIVHCHVRSTASIIMKIAKKYGMITICHSHSTSNGKGIKAIIKNLYQKNIVKYADYLAGCSEKSAEWLYGKKYIDKENCIIIKNAIDTNKFLYNKKMSETIKKKLNLENKFILGQVGRLSEVKNHIFSLHLLKQYLKINENAVLVFIGDGPLRNILMEETKTLGIENNVVFLLNRSNVNEIIQAFDIFLMPSLYEGLPLSLVEAQTASIPCVISDKIEDGIIINDLVKQCSIEKENSIDEWLKGIEDFKNNKKKNRLEEIKNAGFDINDSINKLEKFYEKL